MVKKDNLQFGISFTPDTDGFEKEWKAQSKIIQSIIDKTKFELKFNIDAIDTANKQLKSMESNLRRIADLQTKATGTKPLTAFQSGKLDDMRIRTNAALYKSAEIASARLAAQQDIGAAAAIRKQKAQLSLDASVKKSTNSMKIQRGVMNGMAQFANSYISILGAMRFFGNIKKVTAEFELQRVALGAIIQNKKEADALFGKIKATAIESPFEVRELVTFTKQLAAYRIETGKLFDTMKMLADVSAGLGVDMNRITLAYGQIRAASVLRGTEVRQLTEAGIPVIELLAEKFREMGREGTTVADVFNLISRRAVPFKMVEEIFKDMTSAGGMFFDMQKKQSETLYGVYANLRDNVQISMDKIGNSGMSALMAIGTTSTEIAKNLDIILNATAGLAGTFVLYKISVMLAAQANGRLTLSTIQATAAHTGFNAVMARSAIAVRSFGLAIKSTPIIGWIMGLATAATAIFAFTTRSREANKEFEATRNTLIANLSEVEKYIKKMEVLAKEENNLKNSSNELAKVRNKNATQEALLVKNSERLVEVNKERTVVMGELNKLDEGFAKTIRPLVRDVDAMAKATEEYNAVLRIRLGLESDMKERDVTKDADKYNEALSNQTSNIANLENDRGRIIAFAQGELKSNDKLKDSYKQLLREFLNSTDEFSKSYPILVKGLKGLREATAGRAGGFEISEVPSHAMKKLGVDIFENVIKYGDKATAKLSEFKAEFGAIVSAFTNNPNVLNITNQLKSNVITEDVRVSLTNQIIKLTEASFDDMKLVGAAREAATQMFQKAFSSMAGYEIPWRIADPRGAAIPWRDQFKTVFDQLGEGEALVNFSKLDAVLEKLAKQYLENAESIKLYKNIQDASNQDAASFAEEELAHNEEINNSIYKLLEANGALSLLKKKGAEDKSYIDSLQSEIELVQSAYKDYKELLNVYSELEATKAIKDIYGPQLKNFGLSFTSEDMIKQMDAFSKKAKSLGKNKLSLDMDLNIKKFKVNELQTTLKKQLDDIGNKITQQKQAGDFFEKVLGLTGDQVLSSSLTLAITGTKVEGLDNMKAMLAEQLVQSMSIGAITAEIPIEYILNGTLDASKMKEDILSGKLDIKEIQNTLAKAFGKGADISNATQSLSDFMSFNQEMVTDLMASLGKFESYEERRTEIQRKGEEERRKIRLSGLDKDKQKSMVDASYKKQTKDTSSVNMEEFKMSTDWIKSFEDLDRIATGTIDRLIIKMKEFRDTERGLSPTEIKEINNAISKLTEEQENRNPFQAIKDGINGYIEATKSAIEASSVLKIAQEELSAANAIANESFERTQDSNLDSVETEEEYRQAVEKVNKAQQKVNKSTLKVSNAQDKQKESSDKMKKGLGGMASMANQAADVIKQLIDVLGIAEDSDFGAFLSETAKALMLVGAVLGIVSIAATIATASCVALETVLWPLLAVAVILGAFMFLFGAKTRKANKEIKRQEEYIKTLELAYKKLENAQKNFLGQDWVEANFEKGRNLMDKQLAYQKQLQAEKSKGKDTDEEKVSDYMDKMEDNAQEIKDLQKELYEAMVETDLVSFATDFAKAWFDAYLNFEDTMDLTKEKFNEMVQSLIANSILARVVQKRLEPVFKAIDDMFAESGEGKASATNNEIKKFQDMVNNIGPALNDELEMIMNGLGSIMNPLRKGESDLTGIAKGIAQASEETVLTLAGYANSILYYVVGIKDDVTTIRAILEGKVAAISPVAKDNAGFNISGLIAMQELSLVELRAIQKNTLSSADSLTQIESKLDSVISNNGSRSTKVINTILR